MMPSAEESTLSRWQSLRQKEVNLSQDPQMVIFFCIAKLMDRTNQDVIFQNGVGNNAGEVALTDDDKIMAWREYYSRPLNVKFERPSHELPAAAFW